MPESFKVLMKEMQALCINVEVLAEDGAEIEMRDLDEDVYRAAEELGIDICRPSAAPTRTTSAAQRLERRGRATKPHVPIRRTTTTREENDTCLTSTCSTS